MDILPQAYHCRGDLSSMHIPIYLPGRTSWVEGATQLNGQMFDLDKDRLNQVIFHPRLTIQLHHTNIPTKLVAIRVSKDHAARRAPEQVSSVQLVYH